jgi:hypothetical protein
MKKIIYLVYGSSTESHAEFKIRIFDAVQQLAKSGHAFSLKVVITEFAPPILSVIPFKNKKIACISFHQDTVDLSELLLQMSGFSGVYQVTEALPVSYEKTWADGEPTPGVCLFTLFRQKKGISYDTFIDRWHNNHTPLSLRLHPLWNYSRNVVTKKLTGNSTDWNGIVEEHFRSGSDLLNPFKFFGNPLSILQNMLKVYNDTKSFLEYNTLETYLASEYHIVSNKT